MFDLDHEIKLWLRSFRKHRAFDHGSIREMELHLRDHIEDLMADGYNEKEAFTMAVKEFGEINPMAEEEFRNLESKKLLGSIIHAAMIKNFYFTGIRNLLKHKDYFFLNAFGLAIGITSFMLISLYIINELSYDRFHSNYENIYRVNSIGITKGLSTDFATSNSPLSSTLLADYPEVANATRILRNGPMLIRLGDEMYNEDDILFADSTFFDVFDFKLLKGNPETALVNPGSIILSETYAKKYFGDDDPMGQHITVEEDTTFYVVTGIAEDVPGNSHIQFDMLGSMSTNDWWNTDQWIGPPGVHTYVVLRQDADRKVLEEKIQELVDKHLAPEIEYYTGQTIAQWQNAGNSAGYYLIPLKDIHLRSASTGELEAKGNISYIYIYSLIGIIILCIAIINFVNMATAQSTLRAKEVGVRKVMGSSKAGLVFQFIIESISVSLFAALMAGFFVTLIEPSFADLVGKELAFSITSSFLGPLSLLGLAIIVGVLSGFYPAFVLAAFQPVDVLKGTFHKGTRSGGLRNFLVVMQFTASIIIIIGTLVVYQQIAFMLTKNLGFDKEQIIVIRRPDLLKNKLETFKNDLLLNPNIQVVANSQTIPGKPYTKRSYRPKDNPETYLFMFNHVSFNYHEIMGLEVIAGRFFSEEHRSDSNAVVINEAAAKALGFEDPIGKDLTSPWHAGELVQIIGVVKDYNIESLHNKIEPVALELIPDNGNGYITARISNDQNIRETIQHVNDTWGKHTNNKPIESFFFDEDYEKLYQSEFTTGQVFIVFAMLSIFIACLGLVGLLAFTVAVRKKEIGIRKILGAGTTKLINLLSGEVIRLILIATLISWPLAYLATEYWLQNFANRLNFNPWLYLSSPVIVTLMCSMAISFQLVKATKSNPVNSLRQE